MSENKTEQTPYKNKAAADFQNRISLISENKKIDKDIPIIEIIANKAFGRSDRDI